MSIAKPAPKGRKTYSRLEAGRRLPTEYEIVSSDLHYHYPGKFELGSDNPVIGWYYQHREGSLLQPTNWEGFSDPRRTTYRGYNERQLAGALAAANGDPILRGIHFSLDEDARWHRAWADQLVELAISDTPANAELIGGWVERWRPRTLAAVEALAGTAGLAPTPLDPADAVRRTVAICRQ